MEAKLLAAVLLLGVLALCQGSPAKLDDDYERPESRSGLDGDDDDDDDEKRPYSFAWEASRHYHGAPDREHREERGEDGVTRGVFRYVDPTLRVQEVIYTADENGFHVENSNLPEYTQAQIRARERHAQLFQQIADEHVQIGSQHALRAAELGYEPQEQQPYVAPSQYSAGPVDPASLPDFSPVVLRARAQHQSLFDQIAAQHARIAAERKTNPEDEETGGPYEYKYDTPLKNVEVVSGSVGPSVLSKGASVVAPGDNHPDFQGYGVPLGTFRDDLTEEEALALLEEENQRHLQQFQEEADLHESLVLMTGMPGAGGSNSARFSGQGNQRPGSGNRDSNRRQSGTRASGGNRNNQYQAGQSGNRHKTQLASSASSENRQQYSALGKPKSGSHRANQNKHSSGQGNNNRNRALFTSGNNDRTRSDSHNQRAIGHSGVNYSANQNKFKSNNGAQLSSGQSGQAAHRTQNGNQFSSGGQAAGSQGSGSHFSAGQSGQKQGQNLAGNTKLNINQNHGQYSAGSQNQGQYSAGQNQGQYSATNNQQGQNRIQDQGQYSVGGRRQVTQGGKYSGEQQQGQRQYQSGSAGGHQTKLSSGGNRQHQKSDQHSGASRNFGHHQVAGQGLTHSSSATRAQHSGTFSASSSHNQRGAVLAASADQSSAAHQQALALIEEQRDNHLRQFKKIAQAHEQIGDEHIQLTLSALQKQRMMLEKKW